MNPFDAARLATLQTRLRDLERRIPQPHERPIVEVARSALREAIVDLARRAGREDYWRASTAAVGVVARPAV